MSEANRLDKAAANPLFQSKAEAMNPQVSLSKVALTAFCRKSGIKRLSIFGSALREDFGPESDIDPGLLGIAGMELALSELFGGRKVDLRTAEDLSPYFRQDVLATAEVQYDQKSPS